MRRLGRTELEVFELCFGGNVFGWTVDEAQAFELLDAYSAAGGNFIDTADSYGHWTPAGAGASERIIGRWMAARGNREELVIATKVGSSRERPGLSPQAIRAAVQGSLERLGTEQIDLYYAHRDDPNTPLKQTLESFSELIDEGLVRHVAASNYTAPRLRAALDLAAVNDGLAGFVALQPHYNLLERALYEGDLRDICAAEGLACLPYYPLASGFLTGKYRREGEEVDSPRAGGVRERYCNDRGFAVLDVLDRIAGEQQVSVAAVALAWLIAQPTVLSAIASARTLGQLDELLQSVTLTLSAEQMQALDVLSAP